MRGNLRGKRQAEKGTHLIPPSDPQLLFAIALLYSLIVEVTQQRRLAGSKERWGGLYCTKANWRAENAVHNVSCAKMCVCPFLGAHRAAELSLVVLAGMESDSEFVTEDWLAGWAQDL